jgi:uncharacterized protein (DUF1697 family)
MTTYVVLLRAVNVAGIGRLPMSTLREICADAGLRQVRTYIASGNAIGASDMDEADVRSALAGRLEAYAGTPVGVLVRTQGELADVLVRNPFASEPGERTGALFVDGPIAPDALARVTGRRNEQLRLGRREIYVFYPDGMGTSRLRTPSASGGTMRNMNTISKLVALAGGLD